MGRLPRRIWYGLHALSSGAKDAGAFIRKIDREWESRRWTMKAVLYPYHPQRKISVAKVPEFAYRLIGDLRRQGFILKKGRSWFLTESGREKLEKVTAMLKGFAPIRHYDKQAGKDLIIISFDIPEKEHGKRDWLRKTLMQLGLKFYHQSLWMGHVVIPEEFLHDLVSANIDKHVAIFTLGKQGTLKKIV